MPISNICTSLTETPDLSQQLNQRTDRDCQGDDVFQLDSTAKLDNSAIVDFTYNYQLTAVSTT